MDSKEKLIEYFKFFEDTFIQPIIDLDMENVVFGGGIPNMAAPSPATVEDGKRFTELCKNCYEIAMENDKNPIFLFYRTIMPYSYVGFDKDRFDATYYYNNNVCGIGNNSIGFLPDGLITICTEGYTEYNNTYRDYYNKEVETSDKVIEQKKIKERHICFTEKDWQGYADDMASLCT